VDVVVQRVQRHAVLLAVVEEPAPVVGDDGLLIVLLDEVVATVEEVVPVVGNHVGSERYGDAVKLRKTDRGRKLQGSNDFDTNC
jgi:hypothetical protein